MIPKHFSLVKEHPHSYEIHDSRDESRFHIAKQGLDLGMHAKLATIQHFDEGGGVQAEPLEVEKLPDEVAQSSSPAPAPIPATTQSPPSGDIPADPLQVEAPPEDRAPSSVQAPSSSPAGIPASAEVSQTQKQPSVSPEDFSPNYAEQEKAVKGAIDAESKAAKNTAGAWADYSKKTDKMPTPEDIIKSHKAADDALMAKFQNKEINPDHFWKSQSTGQKIAAGLAMIIGGLGAGASGQNVGMEMINKEIDRDMESQKSAQEKSLTLWKMNREATKTDLEANLATRNQMLTAVEAKAKMYAAQVGGAEAMIKLQPLLMQIQQQKVENNLRLGLFRAQQGGQTLQEDPARFVPYMVKDPAQQKEVYGEIGRAQNAARNSKAIMKAFDDASTENTVIRSIGGIRTPGSVMALHQLMLPNFKQIDGTVRQAAMDESFKNLTPSPGDSAAKIADKRNAMIGWLHSEMAAPIAKGVGLDLSRFSSTSGSGYSPGDVVSVSGKKYVVQPDGRKLKQMVE